MATQVGEAVIKLSFDGSSVNAELKDVSSKVESSGSSAGSKWGNAWSVAAGTLVSKGISKIASTITGNLGKAISRVDTIKNFPKVMTALGYSSEEASDSINMIANSLDGLPTSLDAAVGDIQKLAATMGNLSKGEINATTVGLSLNNMFLAGGKGAQVASNAMEQYNQMLAAGKVDMQSWRSMLDAAPGQLNQLAQELLGATANQQDLYKALQDGTVTFDQLNEAIVRLNREGGDGFASFEEQARAATGGLGTALENLQTRVVKAISKVLDHLDSEKIAELINDLSSKLDGLADVVINIIDFLVDNQWIFGVILAFFGSKVLLSGITKITNGITKIKNAFSGLFGSQAMGGVAEKASGVFGGIGDAVTNAITKLKDILNSLVQAIIEPLKTALTGVGEAIAGFFSALASPTVLMGALNFTVAALAVAAAIWAIGSAVGAIMPTLEALLNNIIIPIAQFIADTVMSLIDKLTDAIIRLTNDAIIPLGEFLVNSFVTILQTISDTIINLTQNALIPLIDTLSGAFVNVARTIGDILTNVIKAALEGVAEVVRALGDGFEKMGNAIKTALQGVQGVLQVFADLISSIAAAAVAIVALVTGHSIDYGNGFAHLDGYAEGGRVIGEGTSTSDSIPALLSDGEYVINAESAQAIGYSTLDALNNGGLPDIYSAPNWGNMIENSVATDGGALIEENRPITVYMNNHIDNRLDAEEIGKVMIQSIRRAV